MVYKQEKCFSFALWAITESCDSPGISSHPKGMPITNIQDKKQLVWSDLQMLRVNIYREIAHCLYSIISVRVCPLKLFPHLALIHHLKRENRRHQPWSPPCQRNWCQGTGKKF